MSSANTRAIAVKLDQETQDRFKRLAEVRQRTQHGMVTEAIHQYLDREEKREAFRQDTLDAWNEHQATGMHANADDVTAWLATWGDDDDVPAPICHK